MKAVQIFSIAFLGVLMLGCSTKYDYDRKYDFSTLKAYEWMATPQDARADPFVTERAKSALSRELDAKGIQRAPDNPDFLIRISNWFVPPTNILRGGGLSNDDTHVDVTAARVVLHVDFVEAKTKQVVWQAKINREITQDKEQVTNEVVIEMMKNFPPDQKK